MWPGPRERGAWWIEKEARAERGGGWRGRGEELWVEEKGLSWWWNSDVWKCVSNTRFHHRPGATCLCTSGVEHRGNLQQTNTLTNDSTLSCDRLTTHPFVLELLLWVCYHLSLTQKSLISKWKRQQVPKGPKHILEQSLMNIVLSSDDLRHVNEF